MTLGRISFGPLAYQTVGFDRIFDELEAVFDSSKLTVDKYPPHNIISLDDTNYIIEMAIAGFKQEDIDITREKGVLTVKANSKSETSSNVNYLYKGIGTRSFSKIFKLADTVVIRNATFENGILQISLENVIPEEQKPLKIEIGKPTKLTAKQKFLAD